MTDPTEVPSRDGVPTEMGVPTSSDGVVVAGESLVDVVHPVAGDPWEVVGGSPMNVAVGLARLGVPTTLLTEVGDDARGARVVDHVRRSGVVLPDASVGAGRRTNTATAYLDRHSSATYDFDLEWTLPQQPLPRCSALHVGSLATTLGPGRQTVLDLVRQATRRGVMVSYDPNVRPSIAPDLERAWRELRELAGLSTVVKVSEEDLRTLQPGRDPHEVAAGLLEGYTRLVVVTHGGQGAWGCTREWRVRVTAPPVRVADTVGAGDAFTAGMLAHWYAVGMGGALLDDPRTGEGLLRAGVRVAGLTCARPGADPPWQADLASTGQPTADP